MASSVDGGATIRLDAKGYVTCFKDDTVCLEYLTEYIKSKLELSAISVINSSCPRCVLRQLAVPDKLRDLVVYNMTETSLKNVLATVGYDWHGATSSSVVCSLCYGLLLENVLLKLLETFFRKLQQLKWVLGHAIEKLSDLQFSVESELEVQLNLRSFPHLVQNNDLEDYDALMSLVLAPIYIQGRYRKLSRTLSQSPWVVEGIRLATDSIEECISEYLMTQLGAKECRFTAGGREDVDVRMLGSGRPFIIQVIGPKVSRNYIDDCFMKSSSEQEWETSKRKTYRCIVWLSKPMEQKSTCERLQSLTPLCIEQATPLRVLHRRSLSIRKRLIHSIYFHLLNSNFACVDLVTDAGTYVKEFIHGDLGRTQPHLGGLLGCEADILQLDVLAVQASE
eukprot:jgi/Galph1/2671/GphlegSOOS_G1370.1